MANGHNSIIPNPCTTNLVTGRETYCLSPHYIERRPPVPPRGKGGYSPAGVGRGCPDVEDDNESSLFGWVMKSVLAFSLMVFAFENK
ncbi:hypothetical protein CDAR_221081 [Caerostris darwini]|uniref:Uncharacterized protein n=1 Tax=Caerostris darwini TaxID=1538125 RepID=A0AAV4R067_9ARAC|nr:hypothetical protein CDAR_221081 [Caerostris darwini]